MSGGVSAGSSKTSVGEAGTSQDTFLYPRRVLVIRAGPRPRRHACVLLNKRTASTFEHVLSAFASAISIESGHVKQLYGVNTGKQVGLTITLPSGFYPPKFGIEIGRIFPLSFEHGSPQFLT